MPGSFLASTVKQVSFVLFESRQTCLSQLTALNGISVSSQPLY